MQVTITYTDSAALTKEEIVRHATHHFGKMAQVTVMPDSNNAHDLIYFGIQQVITHEQLSLLFDRNSSYQQDIARLRKDTLQKLAELLDSVIIDNEAKVST